MSDEPIVYKAACIGQCGAGTLVMRFSDQAECNEWARLHQATLGHRVHCYFERGLPPDE